MLVNGKCLPLAEPCTVAELLRRQGCRAELVAVERNGQIVPRADFNTVLLNDSDELEIVSFVGGG